MNKQLIDIKEFITDFFKRKGVYILLSIIISKILSFFLSFIVIKQLSTNDFGNISYAYNIISFIIPFMGFGIYQSLGRFGPIASSQHQKKHLFNFVLTRGLVASALLIIVVILFAGLLTKSLPNAHVYLFYLSFLIITLFIFETIKIYYRIYGLNKLYAYVEIFYSILLLILGVLFTAFFDGIGYVLALIITPLIISIVVLLKYKLFAKKTIKIKYTKNEKLVFWKYGFFTSLGGLTAQLIFSVDILMIGYLLENETKVALYKVASIIPFSLLFIPNGFIKTDLIKLTQEYQNKKFLKKYIFNYLKLFSLISIVLALVLWLLSKQIMQFFGKEYIEAADLVTVFGIGLIGAFVFRNLFGNLLDAIGWAKISATLSISVLLLDIILNYFMVKEYGMIGAAYSTSILLWVSGIISMLAIFSYLQKLK